MRVGVLDLYPMYAYGFQIRQYWVGVCMRMVKVVVLITGRWWYGSIYCDGLAPYMVGVVG